MTEMKDTTIAKDFTTYELEINEQGEVVLPQKVAEYFGNELVSSCGKDKLLLHTTQRWAEKEKELLKLLRDKPEHTNMIRFILISACDNKISQNGRILLAECQLQDIGVLSQSTVTLVEKADWYALLTPQNAEMLIADLANITPEL